MNNLISGSTLFASSENFLGYLKDLSEEDELRIVGGGKCGSGSKSKSKSGSKGSGSGSNKGSGSGSGYGCYNPCGGYKD